MNAPERADGRAPRASEPDSGGGVGDEGLQGRAGARGAPPEFPGEMPRNEATGRGVVGEMPYAQAMARARSTMAGDGLPYADEMPVHVLSDAPRKRGGPFGASTAVHALTLLALLLHYRLNRELPSPKPEGITVAFQEPEPRAMPFASQAQQAPSSPPRAQPPAAEAVAPPAARKPVPPPSVPREIPPPVPLPAPKRMGEQVPVPHLPVPGTVPPEERRSGKPGPPAPETPKPSEERSGDERGASETDAGAGTRSGPGSAGGAGEPVERGTGAVRGGSVGSLDVPHLRGGGPDREGRPGGGHRRGLDLSLPVDSGAFGDFSFDDKDYDWSDYWSQMYWAIWRTWMNRLFVSFPAFDRWGYGAGKSSLKGTVLVRFVIERNGAVSSIDVLEPSVMPPLDDSAQGALKEVILPRLPEDFPKDREGVTGRFTMDIEDIAGWKESMKIQKAGRVF